MLPDEPPSPEQPPIPDPPDVSPPPEQPRRQRAVAAVRPVIIPDLLRRAAEGDVAGLFRDLNRHYMPGAGFPDARVQETDENDFRSGLKRKAADISRSYSEVFAYLTFDTTSHAQATRLLQMITNVSALVLS